MLLLLLYLLQNNMTMALMVARRSIPHWRYITVLIWLGTQKGWAKLSPKFYGNRFYKYCTMFLSSVNSDR